MSSDKLDNLVRIGQLKKEPPRADELVGLRRSGLARIDDAERRELSFESRFDLAYNAAHALAARGRSQPQPRARDFSSDQDAKPQAYWSISRIWQRRAGGKDPLSARSEFCHGLLALYALRRMGYRPENRYLVFQALPYTVGLATGHWRVLAKAHEQRNLSEYEGYLDLDERLLADVLVATRALIAALPEDEKL